MPILSMFYGIIIRMYYADNKQHHIPHIHAEYGDLRLFLVLKMASCLQENSPRARLVSYWHG